MSAPTGHHLSLAKRIGRYLLHRPRVTQLFRWQTAPDRIRALSDNDWASNVQHRRSTSGGQLFAGCRLLASWSSTQASQALSSGEAEWYALTKTACEALHSKACSGRCMSSCPWS